MAEGFMTVGFNSDQAKTAVRDIKGRFTSFQTNMREAHDQMATHAAELIQEVLKARIAQTGRLQVARTHHGQGAEALINAIMNRDNRTFGYGGFTIMNPQFLTGSVVNNYYRGLEEGSDKLVGREFLGFFILPGAAAATEARRRSQAVLVIRKRIDGTAQGTGGPKAVSEEWKSKRKKTLAALDQRGRIEGGLVTIGRAIPAYHYIREGFAQWAASGDQLQETRIAAARAGLKMVGDRIIV